MSKANLVLTRLITRGYDQVNIENKLFVLSYDYIMYQGDIVFVFEDQSCIECVYLGEESRRFTIVTQEGDS